MMNDELWIKPVAIARGTGQRGPDVGGRGAEQREANCPGSSGGGGFRGRLRGMP